MPQPSLDDVGCTDADTCWVTGSEAVPQGDDGGSSMVLGTTAGGVTWSKATFTVPPGAPEDVGHDAYLSVGQISCPVGGTGCVALGSVDQGSATTPVYSNVP